MTDVKRPNILAEEPFSIAVEVPEPIRLEAEPLNCVANTVLLLVHDKIPIVVSIQDRRYRGFLVQASLVGESTIFSIKLTDLAY